MTAAACFAALVVMPASIAQATSTGGALSTGAGTESSAAGGGQATPGAAATTRVTLTAEPARPAVGQPVRLTVAAPPTGARGFAWDLAGRGDYVRHTGDAAATRVSFPTPGIHSVAVRFTAGNHMRLGVLTLTIAARPGARGPHAAHADRPSRTPTGVTGRVTAHVAGDPGVTIADFHFAPASTTIHVGDIIIWSNSGPSSHTATASDGSFNTGILKKGQSASHTFTQAGTYHYVCQIHPFMHGTIVVVASTTSTTTSSAGTTPTTTTATTTAAAPTGPTLPNTGFNALAGVFAGLVLLGLGAGLRRTRAR